MNTDSMNIVPSRSGELTIVPPANHYCIGCRIPVGDAHYHARLVVDGADTPARFCLQCTRTLAVCGDPSEWLHGVAGKCRAEAADLAERAIWLQELAEDGVSVPSAKELREFEDDFPF